MTIDEKMVAYVANLSHIRLDDEQMPLMIEELGKILTVMENLKAVDTKEAPLPLLSTVNVMRPDIVTGTYERAALLENAPAHTGEAFVVPKTV